VSSFFWPYYLIPNCITLQIHLCREEPPRPLDCVYVPCMHDSLLLPLFRAYLHADYLWLPHLHAATSSCCLSSCCLSSCCPSSCCLSSCCLSSCCPSSCWIPSCCLSSCWKPVTATPWTLTLLNCWVLCSMQKYSSSWRRVQPNVS